MKNENFFKKAFRKMKASTEAQHEIDVANFEAAKAEAKANFEENRFANSLKRAKENSKANWEKAKALPKAKEEERATKQQISLEKARMRKENAEMRIKVAQEKRN